MIQEFNINENWKVTGIYPVGSLYLSINSTNPSIYFGGTWERFANGRVLLGVNEFDSDGDLSAAELTGGEKEHTLTVEEMPSHTHGLSYSSQNRGNGSLGRPSGSSGSAYISESIGGSLPHNNLMPYATCYIWKRIA